MDGGVSNTLGAEHWGAPLVCEYWLLLYYELTLAPLARAKLRLFGTALAAAFTVLVPKRQLF